MKELPLQIDNLIGSPDMGDWDRLAYKLAEYEEWDQAANSLQKAAEADPGVLQRWLTIATWRQRCGQLGQAIATIIEALHLPKNHNTELSPNESTFNGRVCWTLDQQLSLWTQLCHLYAQDSRWSECEQACMEVLERQDDNLEIIELMATACVQTEHLDAAEHLLKSLLRRVPLDPWYRMRFATLLQTQGRLGEAQKELFRLQAMQLPVMFVEEIENSIEYLDQMQFQQVIALIEHNQELRNAMARQPHDELKKLGFLMTDPAIEMLQNVLWDHFNLAPYSALEVSEQAPRIH